MAENSYTWLLIAHRAPNNSELPPNSLKQLQMAGLGWNRLNFIECLAMAGAIFALVRYVHIFLKNLHLVSIAFFMNVEDKVKIFCGKKS